MRARVRVRERVRVRVRVRVMRLVLLSPTVHSVLRFNDIPSLP